MTTRQKVSWGLVVAPVVAALVLVPLTLHGMAQKDEQHARFHNAGKTINGFLSSYCKGVEAALAQGEVSPVTASYSRGYRAPGRGRWIWSLPEDESSVAVFHRRAEGATDFSAAELADEMAEYFGDFRSVDKTICKIDLIEQLEIERSAVLTVKLIYDAVDSGGQFFQDRHLVRWYLVNDAAGGEAYDWKIERDELVEGFRVAGERIGLVEVDLAASGIDFEHRRDPNLDMKRFRSDLQFGVIQHASGGISTADYDLDGRPDLLFLDGERLRLYRNLGSTENGEPRFADVTAESGLDGIGRTHVGMFADFDNDGDRDLFLGRYLTPNRFFRNDGSGVFADASAESGIDVTVPATSATLLDFDRDGFLDIYLGVNGNAFEALPRLPFYAQNGKPNRLFRNDGGERFVDVTEASGTGDVGWSLAVATGDVDGDGWPDLAVANDFGRKNLYRNNRDGTFDEIAREAGALHFSGGMGLTFGDFDDDGSVDLYTSNINSNQRWFGEDMTVSQYIRNVVRTKWIYADVFEYWRLYRLVGNDWVELGQQIGEGNSLFRNRGDGSFDELKDSHTGRAGWGWSVNFFDVDNDADLDLYAANGWISNTPGTDL
ncbi:MAG: VCBS repeat-containing protein [bacterium]|nr:VCBS repeat-containing protein [bacterium]